MLVKEVVQMVESGPARRKSIFSAFPVTGWKILPATVGSARTAVLAYLRRKKGEGGTQGKGREGSARVDTLRTKGIGVGTLRSARRCWAGGG